ncbi:hypothetical protein KEM52_001328 [Ascosphaera acerosa]|nr:hypothetical protein KEM52_001328 [Ascosphaera acerosa]
MAPTQQELSLLIDPLVAESIAHNYKLLSNTHSLASFLFGIAAGILGLQSATGFAFYLAGALFVSFLFSVVLVGRAAPRTGGSRPDGRSQQRKGEGKSATAAPAVVAGLSAFFPGDGELVATKDGRSLGRRGAWRNVWLGGIGQAASGFVLGWAGVGGMLR